MPDDEVLKDPLGKLPRYALYQGRRLRVLEYLGKNNFLLLERDDSKRQVNRDRLTFVKS